MELGLDLLFAVGLPTALVSAVMVVMNVAYTLAAYPAGVLSDRLGRNGFLAVGIVFFAIADVVLAFGATRSFLPRWWRILLPWNYAAQHSECSIW
jgi:MFS family permease